jgi:hypothetical protein
MVTYISGYNLKVLREKETGIAVNVSYTEDGLKWSTNKVGKYVMYEKPKV